MTVKEMIEIFKSKSKYCLDENKEIIDKLSSLPEDMILEEVVKLPDVITSEWAYYWARDVGDKHLMIDKIDESMWAYFWALNMGNRNIMKSKVTQPKWIARWNESFPEDKIEEVSYDS